jgi:hypothetical protein
LRFDSENDAAPFVDGDVKNLLRPKLTGTLLSRPTTMTMLMIMMTTSPRGEERLLDNNKKVVTDQEEGAVASANSSCSSSSTSSSDTGSSSSSLSTSQDHQEEEEQEQQEQEDIVSLPLSDAASSFIDCSAASSIPPPLSRRPDPPGDYDWPETVYDDSFLHGEELYTDDEDDEEEEYVEEEEYEEEYVEEEESYNDDDESKVSELPSWEAFTRTDEDDNINDTKHTSTTDTPNSSSSSPAPTPSPLQEGLLPTTLSDQQVKAMGDAILRQDVVALTMMLVECDFDANSRMEGSGTTALHIAARLGHVGMAQLLIDHWANVNLANARGETPLMIAAQHQRRSMVDFLLQIAGADVSIRSHSGAAALDYATTTNHHQRQRQQYHHHHHPPTVAAIVDALLRAEYLRALRERRRREHGPVEV